MVVLRVAGAGRPGSSGLGCPNPVVANLESLLVGVSGQLVDHFAGDRPPVLGQCLQEGIDGDPAALVEMSADDVGSVAQHVRPRSTGCGSGYGPGRRPGPPHGSWVCAPVPVRACLLRCGGIRPLSRRGAAVRLSVEEREEISLGG